MKYWGVGDRDNRVGIIGIGGLGQMGIRLDKAMGNQVTTISTSPSKEAWAKEIGASNFVVSRDPEPMRSAEGSVDLVLNTVAADHQTFPYISLVDKNGTLVLVGLTGLALVIRAGLIFTREAIAVSNIRVIKDTQEVIERCAKHNINPATQLVTGSKLDQVTGKLSNKND